MSYLPGPQNCCPIKCSMTWYRDEWFGDDLNINEKCVQYTYHPDILKTSITSVLTIFVKICQSTGRSYPYFQPNIPIHHRSTSFPWVPNNQIHMQQWDYHIIMNQTIKPKCGVEYILNMFLRWTRTFWKCMNYILCRCWSNVPFGTYS